MAGGPLEGFTVVEMAGIGPVPFCGMLMSDMGATVIRIDRMTPSGLGVELPTKYQTAGRGRKSVAVDLRKPEGAKIVLEMIDRADALIEGFRPGVMERLGLGPDECLNRRPSLVYGRMTGWGQDGPMASTAGHDINYIALTGALYLIGETNRAPVPPLNLVGDYGGGALYLCVGVLAALLSAGKSGRGQVIDAAMVDGASSLMAPHFGHIGAGMWKERRGSNIADGGSHFYCVYETKDNEYVSVGAIEPKFYKQLLELAGVSDDEELQAAHMKASEWPKMKARLAEVFRARTRAEWTEIFEGSDACFAPLLRPSEAPDHPHMRSRNAHVEIDGVEQPAPAPRFSGTPSKVQGPPVAPGTHTDEVLRWAGFSEKDVEALRGSDVVR